MRRLYCTIRARKEASKIFKRLSDVYIHLDNIHEIFSPDIEMVKKKTLPHLLYLGKWSNFVIKIPRGRVLVYYQGAPNPLFEWEHPEPSKAFLPIYYYYTSELGHTIGVTFDCSTSTWDNQFLLSCWQSFFIVKLKSEIFVSRWWNDNVYNWKTVWRVKLKFGTQIGHYSILCIIGMKALKWTNYCPHSTEYCRNMSEIFLIIHCNWNIVTTFLSNIAKYFIATLQF